MNSSATVKAAVVESFDRPPRYRDFEAPVAHPGEVLVEVRAAALSQLVRAQASGRHYSSGSPPLVPGVDGVGRLENGDRVYFAFPKGPVGAMAERVAVPAANTVPLPDDLDDVTAAAIANPGMSSWAALTGRAFLRKGQSVLVNGASGASGQLAIQIARHLGAGRVVATARNPACEAALRALGADAFLQLPSGKAELAELFREEVARGVDVVLDYLWGPPAEAFFAAVTGKGTGEAAPRIRFVNIGSLAGASAVVEPAALRSSGLEIVGSGIGSLSHAELMQAIGDLMQAVHPAGLRIDAAARPLSEVEAAWTEAGSERLVFTP